MIQLFVCGVNEVPLFAREGLTDIVSIGDPDTHPHLCHAQPPPDFAPFAGTRIHRFEFQDVAHVCETSVTADHVKRLIALADTIIASKEDIRVLFHCQAGIARSTASAFILCIRAGMTYRQAYDHILAVRGVLMPNLLMIKHADILMDQGGKMLDFIADGRPGPPFRTDAIEWIKTNGYTFNT